LKASYLPSPFLSKTKTDENPPAMICALGYPLVFHWVFLGVLVALVLSSAVRHSVPLLVLSLSFLLLAAISRTWSRRSMKEVSFQIELNRTRAFPDESIELSLELINEKRLPLPWVEIEQSVPYRLATGSLRPPSRYSKKRFRWTTSISGRQRLKWRHHLTCRARGEYRLGPARLRSGDMFGLFPKEMIIPQSESVLVYPRIVPTDMLNPALRDVLGEVEAARKLFEDLNRSTGPRDYRRHDPFKRIHWKATARQGRLQVRQFESSTGLSLLLMLDAQGFCEQGREDEQAFELAVSLTASLAYELCGARCPVGLIANAVPEIQIPLSSDRGQILNFLEALARVQPGPGLPLHDLLERERPNVHLGTTLAIITYVPSPSAAATMKDLGRRGHSLFLVTLGDGESGDDLDGIPAFRVPYPDDPCSRAEDAP
jgi:uncharacterized protein (DUF58 family)